MAIGFFLEKSNYAEKELDQDSVRDGSMTAKVYKADSRLVLSHRLLLAGQSLSI